MQLLHISVRSHLFCYSILVSLLHETVRACTRVYFRGARAHFFRQARYYMHTALDARAPSPFWLLPGVIFHRRRAIFVLCEDNKWPNRYQQTAGGVSTDRGWERGPKCRGINWCSLSLTPRLSPPFQTCTTNTFNASNASFVRRGGGGGGLDPAGW